MLELLPLQAIRSNGENRLIFLPIMIVTLPLPSQIVKFWPPFMVDFLQWFAFWSFAGLLTVPWLFCVYQIVTHQLGRTKRIKQVLDEVSAPKVVIVMPCYKEEPEILVTAVNSVVDCDYPPSCIHVFLSFDGDQEDELYLNTIEKLGVPLTLESYPKSIDVTYRSATEVDDEDMGSRLRDVLKTAGLDDPAVSVRRVDALERNAVTAKLKAFVPLPKTATSAGVSSTR